MKFEWDEKKNLLNQEKHDVSFELAQLAFFDSNRVIAKDEKHSNINEERYFCFGLVELGIVTVRFLIRNNNIRIIGAGFWREGKKIYEKHNKI